MSLRKPSSRDAGSLPAAGATPTTSAAEKAWPRTRATHSSGDTAEMREYSLHSFSDFSDETAPPTASETSAFAADPRFSRDTKTARDDSVSPSRDNVEATPRNAPERRAAYENGVVALFRKRLRLVCVLTLVALPLFNIFGTHFTPREYRNLLIAYFCLSAICLVTFFLAKRLRTLRALRFLTLLAYALYCFKAGLVLSLAGDGDADPAFLLGSYNHIVLSLLLLPLSVWECLTIGAIALATMAWSVWWVLMPQYSTLYYSHVFITSLTTIWVMGIAHFQDVTRRRAFNAAFDLADSAAKLRALTLRDALTGGYNRRYLEKTLESEIARAARYGRPLSVVMFDLDDFKNINDSCGHSTGDEVLRAVWRAIIKIVRGIDTAARYGGDEFAVILPEADEAAARALVARLQKSVASELQERFGNDTLAGNTTLSVGITTAHMQNAMSVQELLDCADKSLYAAKRAGKNTVAS